jgi:hypothetical protein
MSQFAAVSVRRTVAPRIALAWSPVDGALATRGAAALALTPGQARLVMALAEWSVQGEEAACLLAQWTPQVFSRAQATDIVRLLDLSLPELNARLIDAIWPATRAGLD